MNARTALIAALAGALSACALSAAGEKVVVAPDRSVLGKSCRQLGMVSSSPPYVLPGDDKRQMRTQTAELGGDTVVVTNTAIVGSSRGIAFDCGRSLAAPLAPNP